MVLEQSLLLLHNTSGEAVGGHDEGVVLVDKQELPDVAPLVLVGAALAGEEAGGAAERGVAAVPPHVGHRIIDSWNRGVTR